MLRQFHIQTQIEEVERLPEIISEVCQDFPDSPHLEMQLQLILEELISNIILHGLQSNKGAPIELECHSLADSHQIRLIIRDQAPAFNPFNEHPEVDLHTSIDEKEIGGLGIHLIKEFADHYEYHYQSPYNITTIIKDVSST